MVFLAAAAAPAAEPFRRTLTSTARNINLSNVTIAGREVTPDCPVPWVIRKVRLHGGKQEGVEVIIVDNGKLRVTLCPTRGMGILSARLGDFRLGWDSPVKDVVHPQFINLQSRGGLGWLDGFNEFLCRCGLESLGEPGSDKFINNVGDEATMELTLHGKIANLPAQEVEVVVDREPPYRLTVRGRVDERMFYGPKLELATAFSTEPGSAAFRLAEQVTNRGGLPQEFEILYHTNFGKPLLEDGTTFAGPAREVTPYNKNAARDLHSYTTYAGPKAGFVEKVYCLRLYGDAQDRTMILLQNREKDRAVALAYSLKELPHLTIWKNTAAEKDGYVTGLEPGTNWPLHRAVERKAGRLLKLAPGASHPMTIDFAVLTGQDAVRGAADKIRAIQGDRQTTTDEKPLSSE
jgi:hypothetical protein